MFQRHDNLYRHEMTRGRTGTGRVWRLDSMYGADDQFMTVRSPSATYIEQHGQVRDELPEPPEPLFVERLIIDPRSNSVSAMPLINARVRSTRGSYWVPVQIKPDPSNPFDTGDSGRWVNLDVVHWVRGADKKAGGEEDSGEWLLKSLPDRQQWLVRVVGDTLAGAIATRKREPW